VRPNGEKEKVDEKFSKKRKRGSRASKRDSGKEESMTSAQGVSGDVLLPGDQGENQVSQEEGKFAVSGGARGIENCHGLGRLL